ncbi:MAG: endonuclease domain-containing protein [Solirubrobacteraceae bacterium]
MTTPGRTLVDLATLLTTRELEDAVGEATARGLVDPQQLHTALAVAVLRGRGAARLKATLERHDPGNARTRSKLERAFLKLCRERGLGRPQVNEEIEGFEVDFAWPERRLIVETDGWAFHRTRTAFDNDRDRDLRLRAAGWDVRRFSYRQILDKPGRVAADLSRPARRA